MRSFGFVLYLVLTVSWFLHMPARFPALGPFRVDVILMALILGALLLGKKAQIKGGSKTGYLLKCLVAYVLLTLPFVEWPGSVLRHGIPNFVKVVIFYYFTVGLITTEKRLRAFIFVLIGCQLFRVAEPVYLHVTEGYWGSVAFMSDYEFMNRLAGAPSDVINPNGLAFVVLTAFPFLHYQSEGSRLHKLRYVLCAPALFYALMLTGSRSGLLGMAVILVAMFIKSEKKFIFSLFLLMGLLAGVQRLSGDLKDRYLSIFNKDSKNAVTVQGRLSGIKHDFQVVLNKPVFGHGLGTSVEANANYGRSWQISHNLFAEVSQELGFVGLILFLFFIKSIFMNANTAVAIFRRDKSALRVRGIAEATQVYLIMNLAFSFASYGLSTYEWYLFGGLSVALLSLAAERKIESSSGSSQLVPWSRSSRALQAQPAA